MDNAVTDLNKTIEIDQIMEMIPHRYPFLFIDKVTQLIPDATAVGIKNVTINEPYFQGHFPGHPIMPGVLIIEAMAQTSTRTEKPLISRNPIRPQKICMCPVYLCYDFLLERSSVYRFG